MKKIFFVTIAAVCVVLSITGCFTPPKNKGDITNLIGRWSGTTTSQLPINIQFFDNGSYVYTRFGVTTKGIYNVSNNKITLHDVTPVVSDNTYTYKEYNNWNMLVLKNINFKDTWSLTRS